MLVLRTPCFGVWYPQEVHVPPVKNHCFKQIETLFKNPPLICALPTGLLQFQQALAERALAAPHQALPKLSTFPPLLGFPSPVVRETLPSIKERSWSIIIKSMLVVNKPRLCIVHNNTFDLQQPIKRPQKRFFT